MRRILSIILPTLAALMIASGGASAATWSWGLLFIEDGVYTHIANTSLTYVNQSAIPRIRFNVDNAHSVNIRVIRCGGDYHNNEPITIPAHDQNYHNVNGAFFYGECIEFYARSLFEVQLLSGYILS